MGALTTMQQGRFFDLQPVTIEGFTFAATTVRAVGRPSIEQWTAAFDFASAAVESSPYWVGELLVYAASRPDYASRLDQAKAVTGLAEHTLHNLETVIRRTTPEARRVSPSPSHTAEVTPLEPAEQIHFLQKARDEGWKVRELRDQIRAAKRRRVIEGQAVLVGQYRVFYADPPWQYRDSAATPRGEGGKAERHYPTMSIEELCRLPVAAHARKHAVLFMWVTTPLMLQNPGPREVIEAWGFEYKSMMTWDKVIGMPGRFFQVNTEHLIVAERGNCPPDHPTPKPYSGYREKRTEHSVKPAATRRMIEKMYDNRPNGPFVELFAREPVEGWDVFGNDAKLWQPSA